MKALEVRLRRYHYRITSIQRKFKSYLENNKARFEIVLSAFKSELAKMQLKFIKQKKVKLEKKLRELKPELMNSLIKRYLKYCYDQHSFYWLSWRKLINSREMSTKELITFRFQLACRRKDERQPLKDVFGRLNEDPESMGAHVTLLPPCLDPDHNHKDYESML
jgi:hypothetical protein